MFFRVCLFLLMRVRFVYFNFFRSIWSLIVKEKLFLMMSMFNVYVVIVKGFERYVGFFFLIQNELGIEWDVEFEDSIVIFFDRYQFDGCLVDVGKVVDQFQAQFKVFFIGRF